jgi:beta-lactamase class A
MYTARMMILGVGVSVLAGTLLSVWDPATQPLGGNTLHASLRSKSEQDSAPSPATERAIALNQEIAPLKAAMQTMAAETTAQVPQLEPTSFLVELGTNQFVDLDGSAAIAAASTIKVPVLIAFFQDVDAGKIRLDESLTLKKEAIGSGSGDIQYLPVGSQFSALDVATRMITISDNTATNMLIARMGGIAGLNQRFQSWGLEATTVRNLLPDLEGTNTTSAKELTLLMARLSQGEFVSLQSRDRILDIMRRTANNSLLPQGLGEGATIAHKTGDIGTVLGDVGLIDLPNGKRYALSVLVKRPFNNGQAGTLIQQLSRISYQHFARSSASLAPAPSDGARDGRARRSRMGEAEDLTGGETRLEESEE